MNKAIRQMALESRLVDPDLCSDTQLITDYGDATEAIEKFAGMVTAQYSKDAARYRYLRELPNADSLGLRYMGTDLDAVIDAAIDSQNLK